MNSLSTFLKRKGPPWFLFLLPVFFVFHGFIYNFYFVTIKGALALTGIYIFCSLVLMGLFYLLLRKVQHAAIMSTFIMSFQLFFGYIQDLVNEHFANTFLTKYTFLAGAFLLLTILLFFYIRKKSGFSRLCRYLNILFLLLILIDAITFIAGPLLSPRRDFSTYIPAHPCRDCAKPDIYIIMLDGYAGTRELNQIFTFDNHNFIDSLSQRGFRTIPDSRSNYNSTPYSVASILNMEYLSTADTAGGRKNGIKNSFTRINENKLVYFLKNHGYDFYNYSIFRVAGQAAPTGGSFVPSNTKLITKTTFLSRLEKDVLLPVATKYNLKWYLKKSLYATKKDNDKIYALTENISQDPSKKPKLIYTHLMMPHHPYYYDEKGNERPFEVLNPMPLSDQKAYITYLQYTNKEILKLVDHILSHSASPPVIALLSDHGFRHFDINTDHQLAFSNLLSLHLPGGDYSRFRDSMTTVNFFGTLMNTLFRQEFRIQKDTTFEISF